MIEKIKAIASSVFGVPVTAETNQENCSKWDSLHHLNLIVELEMEFGVSFEPEEIAEMKSVSEVEKMLCNKIDLR